MSLTKILGTFVVLFSVWYLYFAFIGDEVFSVGARGIAIVLLLLVYILKVNKTNFYFLSFLIFYAMGDLFNYFTWYANPNQTESLDLIYYYVGNSIYILSYLSLSARLFSGLDKMLFKKKYILYVILLLILTAFCVYFISDATSGFIDDSSFLVETLYNTVTIGLMCIAFLNYIVHDDSKSVNLMIGSVLIVFSEILQLAYFYVAEFIILHVICSVLFVLAFLFFYLQSLQAYRKHTEYHYEV